MRHSSVHLVCKSSCISVLYQDVPLRQQAEKTTRFLRVSVCDCEYRALLVLLQSSRTFYQQIYKGASRLESNQRGTGRGKLTSPGPWISSILTYVNYAVCVIWINSECGVREI